MVRRRSKYHLISRPSKYATYLLPPSFELLQPKASRPVRLKLSVYLLHLPTSDGDVMPRIVERRQQKPPWRFHQNHKPEMITGVAKPTLDGAACQIHTHQRAVQQQNTFTNCRWAANDASKIFAPISLMQPPNSSQWEHWPENPSRSAKAAVDARFIGALPVHGGGWRQSGDRCTTLLVLTAQNGAGWKISLPCSKLTFSFCQAPVGTGDYDVVSKRATPGILTSYFLGPSLFYMSYCGAFFWAKPIYLSLWFCICLFLLHQT